MARILVIEDDLNILDSMVDLLESEDFEVIGINNGRDGVQAVQEQQPDLILCDVSMPELDGHGVLTLVRQNPTTAAIPFVFLTARADKADIRQGMNLGADDYLLKPVTPEDLLDAIAARLAKQAALTNRYKLDAASAQAGNEQQILAITKTVDALLEANLRLALERDELRVFYQPLVDLPTGRIIGAEALVRWLHPERGFISPGDFIPLAESSGLILPLGEWVLKTACHQIKTWHQAGFLDLEVAVNLSVCQLHQDGLAQRVRAILDEIGLPAHFLELELTESILVRNMDTANTAINDLKALGIQISIDDFGTEYASFRSLKQLPFDLLKIDRSFVHKLTEDSKNAAITTAMIQMAHRMNLRVVAEGVETEAELAFLRHHGCDRFQGYLFSRPLPADAFEELLRANLPLAI